MIDTHCHIDLFSSPIEIANECERLGIITIGMTNLPSHFDMGYKHLLNHKRVRLALGLHPLHAESHKKEFPLFVKYLDKTSYIGEIGMDFSREGLATKEIQIDSFEKILTSLEGKSKIVSLHSRKAERDVFNLLLKHHIRNAIFHWYSGPLALIDEIAHAGYYFSINPAMVKSKSGQEIIKRIPIEKLLTESDGPFIEIDGRPCKPTDIKTVLEYLAKNRNYSFLEIETIVSKNFAKLLSVIRN